MSILNIFKKIKFFLDCMRDETNKIFKCDILFLCHDVNRNFKIDNKNFSPLLDSLIENLRKRGFVCQTILYPISQAKKNESYNNPIIINRSFLIARIFSFLSKYFEFFNKFNKKQLFKKILNRSSAKIIITIGIDGDLIFAAKKKKVLVVELFHFIGLTTLPKAYNWTNINENLLPDVVLALDEITFKTFKFLEEKNIIVKMIPHPFLINIVKWKKNLHLEDSHLKKIGFFKYKFKVMISLNWIYASDCKEFPYLNNILKNQLFYDEIGQLADSEKDIFWSFRLHPVQMKLPQYKYMINYMNNFCKNKKNIDFKIVSKLPLLNALELHDCHLQMSSSTCYEAAMLGIKSLILCPSVQNNGQDPNRFSDLVQEGYVEKVFIDKEKVLNWVRSTKKITPRGLNNKNIQKYDECLDWLLSLGKLI